MLMYVSLYLFIWNFFWGNSGPGVDWLFFQGALGPTLQNHYSEVEKIYYFLLISPILGLCQVTPPLLYICIINAWLRIPFLNFQLSNFPIFFAVEFTQNLFLGAGRQEGSWSDESTSLSRSGGCNGNYRQCCRAGLFLDSRRSQKWRYVRLRLRANQLTYQGTTRRKVFRILVVSSPRYYNQLRHHCQDKDFFL